jgi:tetratricopeptide (TPR) repeat protein
MLISRLLRNRSVIVLVWILIVAIPTQTLCAVLPQGEDYAKKIKDAENKYLMGDFDNSIVTLEACLKAADFPGDLRKQAYELLAQNYLAKSYVEQAKAAIRKLLELVPSYVPPADNPPYAAEVEQVRKEMGGVAKKEEEAQPQKEKEEAWYEKTWVLVAGGVVVVGVAAIVLLSGKKSEEAKANPLPDPPGLPGK